jgi:hypothetical protein
MNTSAKTIAQDEAELQPSVRVIDHKLDEAEKLFKKCQAAVAAAAEKLLAAERRRQDNNDVSLAGQRMKELREAQADLEDEKERLRIVTKTKEDLERQRADSITAWRREAKERLLRAWQAENTEIDNELLAIQKKRVQLANASMAKLHQLDSGFAPVLQHGAPSFYLDSDILLGRRLPSLEITDTRATFKWLELGVAIKN